MKCKTYFSLLIASFLAVVPVSCVRPQIIGSNIVLPGTRRQNYNTITIKGTNFRKQLGDADFGITISSDKPADNITSELRAEGEVLRKVLIKPGSNATFQYQVSDKQIGNFTGSELTYSLDGNNIHKIGTVSSFIRDSQEITITMALESKNIISDLQKKEANEEWDKVITQYSSPKQSH